jgi:hypothetical protein
MQFINFFRQSVSWCCHRFGKEAANYRDKFSQKSKIDSACKLANVTDLFQGVSKKKRASIMIHDMRQAQHHYWYHDLEI